MMNYLAGFIAGRKEERITPQIQRGGLNYERGLDAVRTHHWQHVANHALICYQELEIAQFLNELRDMHDGR